LSTGERQLIGKCDGIVRSIAYSPDGKTIASASDDKSVRIWNVETKKGKTLGHCDDVVSSVAFASNGKTVASGSWDNTVRLWEVK
jgi:WD40 repeat protein